jgi:hypothetical protein
MMGDVADESSTTAIGAARCPLGLASPFHAGLALAAETVGRLGDCAARAVTTPGLGECDDESEIVHLNPLSLGAARSALLGGYALYVQSAAGSEDAVTTQLDGRWT